MDYDTPLFFHVMEYAYSANGDVIDMVSGNPDWEPPEALREGLREYADARQVDFQYPPSEGLRELREEIAARRNVDPGRVVVTNGGGEANYLAMGEALDRADGNEVLLTDPVYSYYPGKTQLLGGTERYVAAGDDGSLDPADVREAASDDLAAIVVNSPNNPTGAVYDVETVHELAVVAEEHDAYLVSDEVYDHFDYSGEFESALATGSERAIVTNSFSKSMAITGFRVGYGIFPEDLVEGAKSRHMIVNVAGSRPAQYAVLKALRETEPAYYAANRRLMAERVDTFTSALEAAGAEVLEPKGGFYVMVKFDGYTGTLENVERLIDETGVAGMPGEAFGESRSEWLRFALVTDRVEEAARRLGEHFG